jgi:hypothetical protein
MTEGGVTVHQVSIGWTRRGPGGGPGMGALAWSGPEGAARHVLERARSVLWGAETDDRPALSRLVGSGADVLVLYRVPTVDPTGRASFWSHGLVGPLPVLDPEVSLGLCRWDWPGSGLAAEPADRTLPPVDSRTLCRAATATLDELRGQLPAVAGPLASVVAELLRRPAERLSVLRPADPDQPPILLVGVLDLFGRRMPGTWPFTTGGTLGTDQFRIEFVPRPRASTAADAATRLIDPAVRVDDRAADVAGRLVRLYLDDPRALDGRLGKLPRDPVALQIVEDWLRSLQPRPASARRAEVEAPPGSSPADSRPGGGLSEPGGGVPEPGGGVPEPETSGPASGLEPPAGRGSSSGDAPHAFGRIWYLLRAGNPAPEPQVRVLLDTVDEGELVDELERADLPPRMRELLSHELAGRPIHDTHYDGKPVAHVIIDRFLFADRSDSAAAPAADRTHLVAALLELFDAAAGPYLQADGIPALLADVVSALWTTPDGRLVVAQLLERPEPPPLTAEGWHALARSQARELARLRAAAAPPADGTGAEHGAPPDPGDVPPAAIHWPWWRPAAPAGLTAAAVLALLIVLWAITVAA